MIPLLYRNIQRLRTVLSKNRISCLPASHLSTVSVQFFPLLHSVLLSPFRRGCQGLSPVNVDSNKHTAMLGRPFPVVSRSPPFSLIAQHASMCGKRGQKIMAVPAEMSVFKAVDLLQNQPAAFQMAEDMPSGGSADVNG